MSFNRGTDNENLVHTYNGILFNTKKNKIIKFAKKITLSEVTCWGLVL